MKKTILCIILLAANILVSLAQTMQKHTVQRGETQESVAQKYGVTVAAMKEANPNIGEYFYVGMVLNVPEKQSVAENGSVPVTETTSVPATTSTAATRVVVDERQESAYTSPTVSSTTVSFSRKGTWDMTGRLGWFARTYEKGADMDGFGMSMLLGANYFLEEQAFLKFCIGWGTASKNKNKVNSELHSIRVPISINYLVPIGKKAGISFGAGPYFDYVVSGKTEYGVGKDKYKVKFSDIEGAHDMVIGLHGCISIMFSEDWGLFGEYGFGLTERTKDNKENYWSAGIAYSF